VFIGLVRTYSFANRYYEENREGLLNVWQTRLLPRPITKPIWQWHSNGSDSFRTQKRSESVVGTA
jgi:hypothetical protein